jgi:adenylate cyclase
MTRILITDDDPDVLRTIVERFRDEQTDWEIVEASDEEQAFAAIATTPFDVIITDLVMTTDEGGLRVLEEAVQRDPLAMVIINTAWANKLDRYQAFELGAFDCVHKNATGVQVVDELLVKAKSALKFRELTQAHVEVCSREQALSRYFDPQVLALLTKQPEVLDLRETTVTIVFWDIRAFSRLCETLRAYPELIAGFLQEYFSLAAETIYAHSGVLDKFIGDGVMALFGALDHPGTLATEQEAALSAIHAAQDFRRQFNDLLEEWSARWSHKTAKQIDIGLGCGIHTGDALVGNVGSPTRDQFTALGAEVNIAQRLESRASPGQILLSTPTRVRVAGHAHVQAVEPLSGIKNIAGVLEVFEILA